ncbi:MAG: hypothetical protein KKF62_18640 [Bacteroidetes bacterium]|nr:hypothetical protein [Bacteroidota bacterium]MBU1798684.1 hypothetical protein [Bacteroidota bacterium]
MKKMSFVLFALLIIVSTTFSQNFKRYQFKSGKVVYQSSGAMVGTETMYFDNYGMLEVKNTKVAMEIMGIKQETDSKVIMDGNWVYSIDNITKAANKMENPLFAMFPKGTDIEKVGEEMMINLGGKKIGTETIIGKSCDIWEVEQMMSKIWIWKSIPIKTEVNMMGMNITQIATSVEVDIKVSPDEFKLPEGVNIQDMETIDLNGMMGN